MHRILTIIYGFRSYLDVIRCRPAPTSERSNSAGERSPVSLMPCKMGQCEMRYLLKQPKKKLIRETMVELFFHGNFSRLVFPSHLQVDLTCSNQLTTLC